MMDFTKLFEEYVSRMARTHPSFKSVQPGVSGGLHMSMMLKNYLDYMHQDNYKRVTTPAETGDWDEYELQSIEVIVSDIDRLYYLVPYCVNNLYHGCILLARMEYGSRPLYVEMIGACKFTPGDDCDCSGLMFVSRDPNIFMMTVMNRSTSFYPRRHIINDSLKLDEIYVAEVLLDRKYWIDPPPLGQLCYNAIYNSRCMFPDDWLATHLPTLPCHDLRKWITDTVKVSEARQQYLADYIENIPIHLRRVSEEVALKETEKTGIIRERIYMW